MGGTSNQVMAALCDKAKGLVTGDRQALYGLPEDNHARTAEVWEWYCRHIGSRALDSVDVCLLNGLQKISRHINCRKTENMLDLIGYAANAEACQNARPSEVAMPPEPWKWSPGWASVMVYDMDLGHAAPTNRQKCGADMGS